MLHVKCYAAQSHKDRMSVLKIMGTVLNQKSAPYCTISACNWMGDSRASVKKACSYKIVLKTLSVFRTDNMNLETKLK